MLTNQVYQDKISQIVIEEILSILGEKGDIAFDIHFKDSLNANLGITSLELARLVFVLEEKFNYDPFYEDISITSVRTVEDLVNAYRLPCNAS